MPRENDRESRDEYSDRYSYKSKGNGFEDISSHSGRDRERRRPKRKRSAFKSFVSALFAILIICGAALALLSLYLLKGLNTMPLSKSEVTMNPGIVSDSKIKNIALFGLDARDDVMEGRADVVMVLSIDGRNNKIKLTSILRDSLVEIDGYGADKLTHSYVYGYKTAVNTLNINFDLDITDYATVNFYRMADIVDAFGGTDVTITDEESYQIDQNLELLGLDYPEETVSDSDYLYGESGELTLNGKQAVAYARIRYIDGDDERAHRQQNVLKGLLYRMKSMGIGDYIKVAAEVLPLCETSIGFEDIPSLWSLLRSTELETLTIPGAEEAAEEGDWGDGYGWVWRYDLQQAANHMDAFIKEDASPYYQAYYGDSWE